jgi:hypothetical protein
MTTIATLLAAVLVLDEAAPASAAGVECLDTDNLCNAKRFERLAKDAKVPQHRATFLHGAHVSYVALFVRTGKARHLCAARRTFDQSYAIRGLPKQQRASFEAARRELEAHERRAAVQCPSEKRSQSKERVTDPEPTPPPSLAAMQTTRSTVEPPITSVPAATVEPPITSAPVAAVEPPIKSVPATAVGPVPAALADRRSGSQPDATLLPVPRPARTPVVVPSSDAQPRLADDARRGRPLVIAGGLTLGAGLALAGVAGYMGSRTLEMRRERLALSNMVDGFADEGQLAMDASLTRDYERMGTQTLVVALAGGATVVVAVVLIGVGGRRMARVASRAAVAPAPGGLVFRAQF